MRNEIITLITITAKGTEEITEELEVFAEKKAVNRTEFYAAYTVGLNTRYVFVIDSEDYESMKRVDEEGNEIVPQKLKYCGKNFIIHRAYETEKQTELTCG